MIEKVPDSESLRERPSPEDREADYNESMENIRYKTGTSSERDIDPEDAGEGYGLIKGELLPQTLSTATPTDDPRHTAMRALIATVVATGCTCSRCERLRQFVPDIGRRNFKQESASYDVSAAKIKKSKHQPYGPSRKTPPSN